MLVEIQAFFVRKNVFKNRKEKRIRPGFPAEGP